MKQKWSEGERVRFKHDRKLYKINEVYFDKFNNDKETLIVECLNKPLTLTITNDVNMIKLSDCITKTQIRFNTMFMNLVIL